jgi:hypothetical protein
MGSDRARVTYDPKQQYRSVVMQQGRVTLEADSNEASQIASEELRREALDVVGPCGTPDNGYQILLSPNPSSLPYDFSIQAGTLYVGGIRAHLLENVQYSNQPDWQDYGPEDPYWVGLSNLPGSPPLDNEFVYLYLREQEVSAVEDQDLKDIALGGPDTAQRTRLLQRFVRVSCDAATCASGLSAAQTQWQDEGLQFDSSTMRLQSSAGLQVSFSSPGQNQGPCQPQAQGGYVDYDNQLIRVQISGIDPVGNPEFIWAFDGASFLYRVDLNSSADTLVFQSAPVDASHQPLKSQMVEVLRTAADLPNGQYVAATSGFLFQLDDNYDPDSNSVTLPSGVSLPPHYTSSNQSPSSPLFLRVWQNPVTPTPPGTASPLGDTGVLVTLTLQSPGSEFHVGDYWLFAVRPATPQNIYPERYLNAPQPPDGPRLWACPLAVIGWNGSAGTIVSDCRPTFGPLASRALHISEINWPNDDLVSLPAFRNNPLQVSFDFAPAAPSVSDSTMIVAVEIPYMPENIRQFIAGKALQAEKAVAPTTSRVRTAGAAKLSTPAASSNRAISVGPSGLTGIGTIKIPIRKFPILFNASNLPDNLLSNYAPLLTAAASSSTSPASEGMLGYVGLIQPGDPSVASSTVSWQLQLPAAEFVPYLSDLSLAGLGAQMRVRVTLKGRDIWNGSSNPLVYLDGQAYGQPGLRADGITPCTQLILPSGSDARASDFESWFWLSLFVWGQTDYSVGDLPLCLTTADFNGDGLPDIAVATLSGGVFILLNNGSGGFTVSAPSPTYQVGEWPLSIVAADFNGDGFTDLAVTSYTDATVTILTGSGNGTFTVGTPIAVGNGPWALAAADFNGDSRIDLAVTNAKDNTVSILINGGNGAFSAPATSPISVGAGAIPIGLVAVDFDGNGKIDLAVLNAGSNTVSLFTGDGQGNFVPNSLTPTLGLPAGFSSTAGVNPAYLSLPLSITTADFNNDGNADFAIGTIYQQNGVTYSSVVVFLNNLANQGVGDFNADPDYTNFVSGIPASLVATNLDPTNPGGGIDLVATGASFLGGTSTFSVLSGNGDGSFQPPVVYPINGNVNPIAVVSADFNGDGIPDLAMATEGGNVSVLLNEQTQITTSGAVVITGLSPSGQVQVGATLQIMGANFGISIGATGVTFNGVSVSSFMSGSTDTQLFVAVPNINPPQGGVLATLTVENQFSSASTQILVLPLPQPVLGTVGITPGQPSPSPIAAGTTYFPFTLTSNANIAASYTAAATVTGPPWQSLVQLLDANKNPLTNNQVPLTPNQAVTILVAIVIPTGTSGTAFSLGLSVASGQSSGSSGLTNYTVGASGAAQDNTIGLTFGSSNPASAVSGQSITVAAGSAATVTFVSTYTVAGTYTVSIALVQATNWLAVINQPTPPAATPTQYVFTLTASQIPPGGSYPLNLVFALIPKTGATSGQAQFTIQNAGVNGNQTRSYALTVQ